MSGIAVLGPSVLRRAAAWRWPAALHWRRPGALPIGLGGLALLAALPLSLLLVPRWQADAAAAAQALHRRAASARPTPPPPAAAGPAQRLREALPPAAQAASRLGALLALAQRHGLTVASVRQAAVLHGDAADSVPLAWHAQGSYARLRRFVAEALQADPALVLDQLRLTRANPAAALLDADLQWQLLQAADPSVQQRPVAAGTSRGPAP